MPLGRNAPLSLFVRLISPNAANAHRALRSEGDDKNRWYVATFSPARERGNNNNIAIFATARFPSAPSTLPRKRA